MVAPKIPYSGLPTKRYDHMAGFSLTVGLASPQRARAILTRHLGPDAKLPRPGYIKTCRDGVEIANIGGQYEIQEATSR